MQVAQVQSLLGALRTHIPFGIAKNKQANKSSDLICKKKNDQLSSIRTGISSQRRLECYAMLSRSAAAKSLQSCPTLCDPIDSSPPGSAIPGILQARTLEWGAIAFSVLSCSVVSNSLLPMDYSPPGSSVHGGFSRQEYWSGLPCPPPGDLPNPGIRPGSPTLQVDSLPSEPPGKPSNLVVKFNIDCKTRGDKAICVGSILLWFIKYRESLFLEFSCHLNIEWGNKRT